MQPFPHLFRPLRLRHVTLRNRITFGAHTANMAEGGLPGERHLGYYLERAKGGAGMIVVEPVPVHATGVLTRGNFKHSSDDVIPHFRRITDACKAEGAVMLNQLYHVGQHGDWDNSFEVAPSPSGRPSFHDSHGSQAMSEPLIEEIIASFVAAAVRAKASGFQGVELFAAYNALMDQFWTPFNNRRDDAWGGSLDNRCRFSRRVMEGIRKACGEDFVIGLAVSMQSGTGPGLTLAQLQEVIAWHDRRQLMDYVTCGVGSYFEFVEIIPTFVYADKLGAPYAEALKQAVTFAKVQAEGHIRTPENADYVVASGQADLISIVRGQIADPHLAAKARDGRPQDIRPCISCNRMCWGRRFRDYWISCLVNPSAGREFEWDGDRFAPAGKPKRVLVVGGGPAGLEAARVAAERGHRVTLAEAGPELGGRFRLAGLQPRRTQILDLIRWYETQLEQRQVTVQLNTYLEPDDIAAGDWDHVVAATGALPDSSGWQRGLAAVDAMPGAGLPNVFSAEAVMSRDAPIPAGAHVLVYDDEGNWKGCGTAWHLAEKGFRVTLLTSAAKVGAEIERTSADIPLRRRLKQLGVTTRTECAIRAWSGTAAVVVDFLDSSDSEIAADALVFATTGVSHDPLTAALTARGIAVSTVGDAAAPREANVAIFEARRLARTL